MRPAPDGRAPVDPWKTPAWLLEQERVPGLEPGQEPDLIQSLTVFLTGAECLFSCVFCDLWRYTLEHPTPPGAITHQVETALAAAWPEPPSPAQLKLYNASNFFDPRAVPQGEEDSLLALLSPFARVVVECHPRLVGQRCQAFAAALEGRLEVAMGLETIHPEALPRLDKSMTLGDFQRACRRVLDVGASLRAFVLVGSPFVPVGESVTWAVRSCEWAFEQGVGLVSLIPVRPTTRRLEELASGGYYSPPSLGMLEEALERCLELGGGVVNADLWDLELFSDCEHCAAERRARLARMNFRASLEPAVACPHCSAP